MTEGHKNVLLIEKQGRCYLLLTISSTRLRLKRRLVHAQNLGVGTVGVTATACFTTRPPTHGASPPIDFQGTGEDE
ncbi:uncharacterized protein ARMOST_12612 [Armillaria ostoyae]|uniref:Uncharacterized protein n=1 Tax=Armillaria ostoyae TaxID=47428 RepID=A0A284RKH9_ARMOS|nr:uncharacterized protein ARMOST_12612 [Armillaria ostoyae]